MSIESNQSGHTNILSGTEQISWTPDTPVPPGVTVENLRRRGIDQLCIKISYDDSQKAEARTRTWFSYLFANKPKSHTTTLMFAEDQIHFSSRKFYVSEPVETVVKRTDVTAVDIVDDAKSGKYSLQIWVDNKELEICDGLPQSTLVWLKERLLLEAGGLVSRPLGNVGRRSTRKTSNPDHDPYKLWPSGPNRLIALFLQETPEHARLLEESIKNNDWATAEKQAHWIKSTSAAVGATQLSELCQRIEIDIVTNDFSQTESLSAHFRRELERVTHTLTAIVNDERGHDANHAAPQAPEAEHAAAVVLKGTKILLVEDSLVNQAFACSCLEQVGCDTTVASSGEAAVEHFDNGSFDLILMDCQMDGMSGFEATEIIRARELTQQLPRTPIVALTANALRDDRTRCLAAGMNDYLSKPYEDQEIFDVLLKWLPDGASTVKEQQSVLVEGQTMPVMPFYPVEQR